MSTAFMAPGTPTETLLAQIWREVLGAERIGVNENFFELGGNSHLAMKVVTRVHQALGRELSPHHLFDAPTVALLARFIDELQPSSGQVGSREPHAAANRRRLMERRLEKDGRIAKIPKSAHSLPVRASFVQEQMWLLDQIDPEHPVYNVGRLYRVRGPLDVAALEAALLQILQRHESLRTGVEWRDQMAVQIVRPVEKWTIRRTSLTHLESAAAWAEVDRLVRQHTYQPFRLDRDILLRAHLYEVANDDHALLVNLHHISTDAWSLWVLWHELSTIYAALVQGKPPCLPELPIQYVDFSLWQHEQLPPERLSHLLQYWREQIHDVSMLQLPTDHPRQVERTYRGAEFSIEFDADLVSRLRSYAHGRQATLFNVVLAGFEVLLHRLSAQEKFVVGTVASGRSHVETEPLIGCFINTLALRADLAGDPDFDEVVKRVRATSLAAWEHAELPFEKLVADGAMARDVTRSPIFQVSLTFHNTPPIRPVLEGAEVAPLPDPMAYSRLDLSLVFTEHDGVLRGSVEFNLDLFAPETVRRWMRHYETLLREAVSRPDELIVRLPLLTTEERQKMLVAWNATTWPLPSVNGVHELIEARANSTPDAPAVVQGDRWISYGALAQNARRMASTLRVRGADAEVLVGLFADRSLEMIAGVLGILQAGAAYVPLDPECPQGRIDFMVEDARLPIILTQRHLVPRLQAFAGHVVILEDVLADGDEHPSAGGEPFARPAIRARDLAYMIYTSGSTGRPKGVLIEHRSLANYVLGMIHAHAIGTGDRLLQIASIGFDASVEDIFVHLCAGSTLVLRTDATLADAQAFIGACRHQGITILDLPTAYWHELAYDMRQTGLTLPDSVRLVLIGGEQARRDGLTAWRECTGPHVRLINLYGPTETTISATAADLTNVDLRSDSRDLPIGRALPNTRAYVLDRSGEPVPIGVPGELLIGGVQVARGYHRQPEMTAQQFVPDNFSAETGERLYRTGDLVRYRSDGMIEFLGRLDQQTKIRGFRVEPGEAEQALTGHPGIRQAVVSAQDDGRAGTRLVAYVVPSGAVAPPAAELREYLGRLLPDYMVPAAFVVLDRIPVTSGGKIDRSRLPAPDALVMAGTTEFVAPASPLEQGLADMWQALLQVGRVGRHDDFFGLGGHSLLAMRLASRVWRAFGVSVTLRELFSAPTVARLAALIEKTPPSLQQDAHRAVIHGDIEENLI